MTTDPAADTTAMTAQNRSVWLCVKASLDRGEDVVWTETPDVDPDLIEPMSGAECDRAAARADNQKWSTP